MELRENHSSVASWLPIVLLMPLCFVLPKIGGALMVLLAAMQLHFTILLK